PPDAPGSGTHLPGRGDSEQKNPAGEQTADRPLLFWPRLCCPGKSGRPIRSVGEYQPRHTTPALRQTFPPPLGPPRYPDGCHRSSRLWPARLPACTPHFPDIQLLPMTTGCLSHPPPPAPESPCLPVHFQSAPAASRTAGRPEACRPAPARSCTLPGPHGLATECPHRPP